MKKSIVSIGFAILIMFCVPEYANSQYISTVSYHGNSGVYTHSHPGHVVTTGPNMGSVQYVHHQGPHNNIVTPPPPPPKNHKYRYDGFAGRRNFPARSYYIPSYCMTVHDFYINPANPFCNQYRPIGSNMYVSF